MQVPSGAQQEPLGSGQGLGSQRPKRVHTAAQSASTVMRQLPSLAQHEPVGWAQGFGSHTDPAPIQTLGNRHAASVLTVQLPSTAQHAPIGCGQGFGEQTD